MTVPEFVLSGGTLAAPAPPAEPVAVAPTLAEAADRYVGNLAHLAPATRLTVAVHLRTLQRVLGPAATGPVDRVTRADLERYVQGRLGTRAAETVKKERGTLVSFFAWCAVEGFVASPPTAGLTPLKGSGDAHRFQTLTEIEAVVARGGLDAAEEWALWDRLDLTPPEVGEVLDLARTRSRRGVSHVLHPDLEVILADRRGRRPRGQFVACDEGSAEPLALHQAAERFAQPLKGTRGAIPERGHLLKLGDHTDRHSIASNLAAAGVDRRVVDELMGHTTEAMRKRYRHLGPPGRSARSSSRWCSRRRAAAARRVDGDARRLPGGYGHRGERRRTMAPVHCRRGRDAHVRNHPWDARWTP